MLRAIQFGKNLRTLQETGSVVQVTFEDGEEVVGNLVIGSDGPYSLTRGILLGEAAKPKRFEGAVILNFTQSYDAETALIVNSLHPISKTCTHPDGYGMIFLSSKLISLMFCKVLMDTIQDLVHRY